MTTLFHYIYARGDASASFPCNGVEDRGHVVTEAVTTVFHAGNEWSPQNTVVTEAEPPLPPLSCRCAPPNPHKDIDHLTRCTRCGRRCPPKTQLTLTDNEATA